ncbi:alpha/beta hydrolase [Williamsia herbipolensis]|uniref:alpha/beta hydrolase n=1 Tax=Williamsia herbipolensis TaxID=1603258 RepID=UPI000AA8E8AA|nr:alpha/beta hydrolase [Williamsia herbipolensis]
MSSPTVSQVRAWSTQGSALTDTAAQIDSTVDAFDAVMNDLLRDVDAVSQSWQGDAARASSAQTDAEKQFSNRLGIAILDIADDINRLGPTFLRSCEVARSLADSLTGGGYLVADNGTVTPPADARPGHPVDVPAGAEGTVAATIASTNAAVHQQDLMAALATAGQADADLARQVEAALAALGQAADRATTSVPVRPEVSAIVDGRASLPSDPKALNAFWDTLTANEKAALWNADRSVGNRDGIPAADRDHFNRRHLAEMEIAERAKVNDYIAAHPYIKGGKVTAAPGPGGYVTDGRRGDEYAKVTERYRALTGLGKALDDPTGSNPRFLLQVDDRGRGAVAVNNPDTAANVTTYVPGTGSNLGNIGGGIDRAQTMVGAAERADPRAATSVVAWYGYDAPQGLGAAAGPASAAGAAGPLDSFQDGLRATHEGATASHNTVLGHSYGTVVVGEASSEGHTLDADDLVFLASPGIGGPNSPDDLSLTGVARSDMAQHVYASTATTDPIGLTEGIHGISPNNPEFGAQRFTSDHSNHPRLSDHSAYWDTHPDGTQNQALTNMALIMTGRGDETE